MDIIVNDEKSIYLIGLVLVWCIWIYQLSKYLVFQKKR